MSKLRIILIVFIPTLLTSLVLLHIYVTLELKSGLQSRLETLQETVNDYSINMEVNAKDISQQVNVIAALLNNGEADDVADLLEESMKKLSFVEGLIVAYDPVFLSEVQAGQYPEFDLRKQFRKWVKTDRPPKFAPCLYRDKDGKTQYSDEAVESYDSTDWYLVPKMIPDGQWLNPFPLRMTGERVSAYGRPFFYKGKFAGVVTCFVRIESLIDPTGMKQSPELNVIQDRFFIVNRCGRVIYHSDYVQWPKFSLYSMADERGLADTFKDIDRMISGTSGQIQMVTLKAEGNVDRNEQSWYVFSAPRSQTHWTVVNTVDQAPVQEAIQRSLVWFVLGIMMVIVAICTVVTVLLIHAYSPIEEVTRVAKLVAGGNLTEKVDSKFIRNGDDIGEFIKTFNGMIDNLKDNITRAVAASSSRLIMENEFQVAQEMQESFLPVERSIKNPECGFAIAANLVPAKFVAGDFFNYWKVTDTVEAVLIADVSGKGVGAAMVMLAAQTLLRATADRQISPGEVVTRVNAQFTAGKPSDDQIFITLFFAYYDSTTGKIRYASAGHNPPYILRRDGRAEEFPIAENVVLGIVPNMEYVTRESELAPGETLFLYTDGATDAVSPQGKQFGSKNLEKLLLEMNDPDPDVFLENVLNGIDRYRGTLEDGRLPQADDTTIVILTRSDETAV